MAETTRASVTSETAGVAADKAVRRPRGTVKAEPLAEAAAGWERPVGSDPRDPVPAGEAQYATEDVLVPRADVPGAHVLVLEGERLPAREDLAPAPGPADRAKVLKSPMV